MWYHTWRAASFCNGTGVWSMGMQESPDSFTTFKIQFFESDLLNCLSQYFHPPDNPVHPIV